MKLLSIKFLKVTSQTTSVKSSEQNCIILPMQVSKDIVKCSYVRLEDEVRNVHCAFVMRKSLVAPLKRITILWLELTAAVCSIRISQQIHRELEYRIDEDFYGTDSKVVLGYLNNESKRFHMDVASRVQEIQDSTDKKQWHYIESQLNPRIRHCAKREPRNFTIQDGF